jgi:hypothetical protein
MNFSHERKRIYKRLLVGYLGVVILVFVALLFSLAQGSGWKPIFAGFPVYMTFFLAVTYHFIKDIRSQRRRERGEPEPPRKRGPWEDE